jgi:two-component system sensor kinase ParS
MLRLFLGLFLVMTVGLVLALQTVEHTFNALLDNQMQAYNREARGQAWSLVEHMRDQQGAAREQQLEALRPHYGLSLKLIEADQLDLSNEERPNWRKTCW